MSAAPRETHPSFGVVGFHRESHGGGGRTRLFGSPLSDHYTTVTMTVKRAERYQDLDREVIHGCEQLIEIELSSTQFAEAITSLNMGDGVPCTLRYIAGGAEIPRPPETQVESARIRDDFARRIDDIRRHVKAAIEKIDTDIAKSVPASKKRDWQIQLGLILQEVEKNWPFAVDQFQRAADRVVKAAKGEVDAVVTHAIHVTGIKELRRLSVGVIEDETAPALNAGPDLKKA